MLDIIQTPEFGQFVVNVLITLVAIIVPLIGNAVRGFLKSKASDQQFQTILTVVKQAVHMAEQAGLAGRAIDKKETAIAAAEAMLADRGIRVDLDALDAAIEAAVAREFNDAFIAEAAYQKSRSLAPTP